MKIRNMEKLRIRLALLTVVISITCFNTGCGPSYENRQSKNEEERKELIPKNQENEKRIIGQIVNKNNAVYFPPENLGDTAFTYDFQEFFKTHSQKSFVFKGYLEDIEQTENGIIVEFFCPIGRFHFITEKGIRFRLTISEDSVKQFLKRERKNPMVLGSRSYIDGPDYYVVAKVKKIERSRIYMFDGTANGEEVEIDSYISKNYLSIGLFIDAVGIPKN